MLGEEIRNARLTANLTQEQLAFEADISRNYVSLLELNEKSPTVEVLLQIARAVGMGASTLIEAIEQRPIRSRRKGRR